MNRESFHILANHAARTSPLHQDIFYRWSTGRGEEARRELIRFGGYREGLLGSTIVASAGAVLGIPIFWYFCFRFPLLPLFVSLTGLYGGILLARECIHIKRALFPSKMVKAVARDYYNLVCLFCHSPTAEREDYKGFAAWGLSEIMCKFQADRFGISLAAYQVAEDKSEPDLSELTNFLAICARFMIFTERTPTLWYAYDMQYAFGKAAVAELH